MPRPPTPGRLGAIVEAAITVFGRVGLANAQMADIAREAGVSVGTLYNYVEGKDVLLLLAAEQALTGTVPSSGRLPVGAGSAEEVQARFAVHLRELVQLPALEAALAGRPPRTTTAAAAQLRAILEELYDLVARTRRGADALERSARDVPELADLWYAQARLGLLGQLAAWIERAARSKAIPAPADPAVAARFAAEATTWFARHRHGDPDGAAIPDELARATTIDLIVRGICHGD